ncbi:MAG: hypothetical protein OQJ89_15085 [Kangiellaceae bacterium]|nr:hypothetical protein [Kangiellaceae bacterium]MCW8997595.1 hypothetical protein [Kangiellaceae bacterium]MCW9018294.1 hypothetical protein [Kangiellaceae bacterium]
MWNDNILYLAFIVQIFVISVYFPSAIVSQMRRVIEKCPPKEFPKLYPVSMESIYRWIKIYQVANYVVMLFGFYIVIHAAVTGVEQMLGLKTPLVIFGYFMLQYLPMLLLEFTNVKYMKKMREANQKTKRKADLTRRKLSDYIDSKWVWITLFSHFVFVGVVIHFMYNPFDGFGGLTNLLIVFLTDLFFVSMIAWRIYSKRRDPYQAKEDRYRVISNIAKGMFVTINLIIVFVSFTFINKAYGSPAIKDIGMVVYFIILAIISLRSMLIDVNDVNFDVYRDEQSKTLNT